MIDGCYTLAQLKTMGIKISRSTFYRMEESGVIKFRRLKEGGKIYVKLSELENALK